MARYAPVAKSAHTAHRLPPAPSSMRSSCSSARRLRAACVPHLLAPLGLPPLLKKYARTRPTQSKPLAALAAAPPLLHGLGHGAVHRRENFPGDRPLLFLLLAQPRLELHHCAP